MPVEPEPPEAARPPMVVFAQIRPRPPRTIVLTYHDMVPRRDARALWFDCTPEELQAQLDWLERQGARFISAEQLYAHLIGRGEVPQGAVCITFADNYRGFLTHAWPILRARKIPVTLFVHTGHVGSNKGRPKMTWDELRALERDPLVRIASQTVSHPADIRTLSEEEKRNEFVNSRQALDKNLAFALPYVAYPNGKHDTATHRSALHAGYLMGFSEAQRPAERTDSILAVPRYVHTKYREAWRDVPRR
jgi:peptidoglycan/xylan/chitin deacetylase (PgdA/CDA1 family)